MKISARNIVLLTVISLITISLLNNSYALNEEEINNISKLDIMLEQNDNASIYDYIDLIDDSLIPTATFNMSNKLNENYDFLTIFAINFILNNEEYYKDKILIGNEYIYNDYTTNKYIDIKEIYDITSNILGKRDYYIISDYLKVENDLIPLLLIRDYSFNMEIEEIINVNSVENALEVLVKYKNIDLIYKYVLEKQEDKYIISNIEVS